ncbi:hypothetical protein KCG53_10655 [Neisseria subflava]|uniref:Uncharacterized protein n=1 Tax=Neisseria subflava TaxID=28449 RepID=A0A9X9N6T9_NEISU|nr:hypothetical protein KCG53_10655 [Neisseria subflava]DAK51150.1 MAG TPA: hypothetical protein [Caudoviricetes sp.]
MDWPELAATIGYTFKGSAGNPLDLDLDGLLWWYDRAVWINEQISG